MSDNEWTWQLSPAEYDATVEKINKINARAEKRGFTGRIVVEGIPTEIERESRFGFKTTELVYMTTLTGNAPSYAGWTLKASLEWDANAGLIVRTVPGIESIDRSKCVEGHCDHCNIDRYRKATYVVENDSTGEVLQVGSTCIKDFLGWDSSVVFLSSKDVKDELDGFLSGGSYDHEWKTLDVLAIAWAAIQVNGWMPASGFGTPTKQIVLDILMPPKGQAQEMSKAYDPFIHESYDKAQMVREFVLSDDFSGDSEYVLNLKAIVGAEFVSRRSLGFLVSAPQAWAKAVERDLIRKSENAEVTNEFFGSIGDKVELKVTMKSFRYIDSGYGTSTLYTMVTDSGYRVKWFASKDALGTTPDTEWTIKGTIKKHDVWNDQKSTIVTRCKVI
jgi:hypothetical protein